MLNTRIPTGFSGHHLYYLLDKNQSHLIPKQPLKYNMKMRFYFQEYDPLKHLQLYRWHWQTAMGSGEYDVPKCKAGTPPDQCVYTIKAKIRVSDFANGPCDYRSGLNALTPACKVGSVGFKPIFLGGHCHAPTCLSMELFNADTGESICRNVPTYGHLTANATGDRRFEEKGYLALPPCVWGDPAQVRVASRSIPPRWGSIRFRLAPRTYNAPPCGPSVRVVSPTKSRKIPTRKTLLLYFMGRALLSRLCCCGAPTSPPSRQPTARTGTRGRWRAGRGTASSSDFARVARVCFHEFMEGAHLSIGLVGGDRAAGRLLVYR